MEIQNLNKNSKEIIRIIYEIVLSKGKDYKIKFKDIKNWKREVGKTNRLWDMQVDRGLQTLIRLKLVIKFGKKKDEIYYKLNPKYLWQALKIGRQNSDIFVLQSSHPKDIIDLSTSKEKTTIYGLPEEIFYKSDFESRTLDYSQKETLEFIQGMKTTDLLGKYFGVPLTVEIHSNRQSSDEEVVNKEVEYYLDLMSKGAKSEDLFKRIITSHRNAKIEFNELGGNIANYLIELKRKYRKKKIAETFKFEINNLPKGRLKSNLFRLKDGFIGILAYTDHDENFLRQSIFGFYGDGVGGYSHNENPKLFWSFHKFVNSLNSEEKDNLLEFLWNVFKENLDLYPTRVAFVCRGHSVDIFPEGIPFKQ